MPYSGSPYSSISNLEFSSMEPLKLLKLAHDSPDYHNEKYFPTTDGADGRINLTKTERKLFLLHIELRERCDQIIKEWEDITKFGHDGSKHETMYYALEKRRAFIVDNIGDNLTMRIPHDEVTTRPVLDTQHGFGYMCMGDCPDCNCVRKKVYPSHWKEACDHGLLH